MRPGTAGFIEAFFGHFFFDRDFATIKKNAFA